MGGGKWGAGRGGVCVYLYINVLLRVVSFIMCNPFLFLYLYLYLSLAGAVSAADIVGIWDSLNIIATSSSYVLSSLKVLNSGLAKLRRMHATLKIDNDRDPERLSAMNNIKTLKTRLRDLKPSEARWCPELQEIRAITFDAVHVPYVKEVQNVASRVECSWSMFVFAKRFSRGMFELLEVLALFEYSRHISPLACTEYVLLRLISSCFALLSLLSFLVFLYYAFFSFL